MQITSKLIELKLGLPIDNDFIEVELRKNGIIPLRWAIVKVKGNILTVSVACVDL